MKEWPFRGIGLTNPKYCEKGACRFYLRVGQKEREREKRLFVCEVERERDREREKGLPLE